MRQLLNMHGRVSMNLKLLFIINDDEKKINLLTNEFSLPFNTIMHGEGTASQGILDFLGLKKEEKVIFTSIIPDIREKEILSYIKKEMRIKEIGKGLAFTIPLSSSPMYIHEVFKKRTGDKMKDKKEKKGQYHLLLSIIVEGFAEKVMTVAKKAGANGGTLLKGRETGNKNAFKLFNMTVEPEKDILLIVCNDENKNKIMEAILEKYGVNTEARGICVSLPIDSAYGLEE